jgi:hypothetical protein
MATEKLGKALLVSGDTKLEEITRSHAAFVKFMRIVSNNRNIHSKLGMTKTQLRTQFNRLLPIAYQIEILAPALAQSGPNPEYPWPGMSGRIFVPSEFSFPSGSIHGKSRRNIVQIPVVAFVVDFEFTDVGF